MRVVDINSLNNRMTEIVIARRFLIFLWKYTVYRSYDTKVPYEEWKWYDYTASKKTGSLVEVNDPHLEWYLNEFTRGDRI